MRCADKVLVAAEEGGWLEVEHKQVTSERALGYLVCGYSFVSALG
jgi:hypothetical protein